MGGKILVVDDDPQIANLISSSLKSKGYDATAVTKGVEAIDYLGHESNLADLKLLILDRIIPDVPGDDILRFFREKYQGRVPILFLSSLSAEKDVLEGLKMGADDYISKPFNIDVLMQKVSKLIK